LIRNKISSMGITRAKENRLNKVEKKLFSTLRNTLFL